MITLTKRLRTRVSILLVVLGAGAILDGWCGVGPFTPPSVRGIRHHEEGRLQEAARLYGAGLRRAPDDAALHLNLGIVLLGQGRLDEAEEHLSSALEGGGGDLGSRAHHNLALVHLSRAMSEEGPSRSVLARNSLANGKQALRLEPTSEGTRWNLELALRIASERPASGAGSGPGPSAHPDSGRPAPSHPASRVSHSAPGLVGEGLLNALRSQEAAAQHRLVQSILAGKPGMLSGLKKNRRGPPW